MQKNLIVFLSFSLLSIISTSATAHHGVAGLGSAGLRGPGAPVEAATSANLPAGKSLAYMKLDHASYETFDSDPANPESDYANYWMLGLGHGFTSWFSAYAFLPYHDKRDEAGDSTHGFCRCVGGLAKSASNTTRA